MQQGHPDRGRVAIGVPVLLPPLLHKLDPPTRHFTGRAEELRRLSQALTHGRAALTASPQRRGISQEPTVTCHLTNELSDELWGASVAHANESVASGRWHVPLRV